MLHRIVALGARHAPLALLLAASLAHAQTPERWNLPFDARDWRLVAENTQGRLTERIYVPPGENEYFWNERLTIGHQRMAFSPDDYLAGFLDYLNENCRPYKMKPLQQEKESVLLEIDGDCRISGPQFEYRRVVLAKDGVHILAYAAKPHRLSEPRREAWLKILSEASVKPLAQDGKP